LREVKCKNLASKLCAISKPYLKHYFGRSTLCSSSSQYKISSCPTRVSLYPKAHSKVPLMYNTTILASVDKSVKASLVGQNEPGPTNTPCRMDVI
jgi:hypothetical protein